MTRHGKNATASSVYSYHEKQKDAQQSEYGTQAERLGKDSVKEFDACCLTLQPCKNPMISPDGYLFDKEAILEYIITQKKTIARQMKKYEKQKKRDAAELKELAKAETESKIQKFVEDERSISSNDAPFQSRQKKTIDPTFQLRSNPKTLPSFWIPSLTPAADKSKIKKPNDKVLCPMTGKPLKFKDLISVKFTPISDGDKKTSMISKQARWQCAVTHDTLGNSIPCVVLRQTGDVVTSDCVEKIIKKDLVKDSKGIDKMLHPLTGQQMTGRDIIPIHRGGTGYAQTNEDLKTKSYRPVLMV